MSTRDGTKSVFRGKELSHYVYLERRERIIRCKVMFPMKGKYRLDLLGAKYVPGSELQSKLVSICVLLE